MMQIWFVCICTLDYCRKVTMIQSLRPSRLIYLSQATKSDVATMYVVVYDYVQQNVTNTNKHVCTVHGINGFKCGVKQVRISSLTWPWNFMIFMTLKEIIFGVPWFGSQTEVRNRKMAYFPHSTSLLPPLVNHNAHHQPTPHPVFGCATDVTWPVVQFQRPQKQNYISKTWILWFFVRDS